MNTRATTRYVLWLVLVFHVIYFRYSQNFSVKEKRLGMKVLQNSKSSLQS